MMYRFIAFAVCAAAMVTAAPTPPALRLNHDVEPRHISLDLKLDPGHDSYTGSVTIALVVNKPVNVFWLNATDLKVASAELKTASGTKTARIVPGGDDFVGFEFDAALATGPATLELSYSGDVNTKSSSGIFLSRNKDDRYLYTQFEPIDARRAFPCFDEPGFKIPWRITLHVPQQDVAVSNTGVESEATEANNMKIVRFRETKPLPSYLIAFAVGPLEFVEAGHAGANRVPVRIVVPRGTRPQAQYAAQVSAEMLTRLEKYFGIPYPYDKADQVAIPLSFGGAMENPGLVTYDASIILASSEGDTESRRRKYAEVAAHELAHQWFGDMVTMKWWNDVWLNESFATWMSARLIADWKPEWQTRSQDQDDRLRAVNTDLEVSARRINQPAESKSDIGNAFDRITYEKGGSVLAMFENAIGPDRFQKAVHDYLTAHLFGNAGAEDFLNAIGSHSKPEYAQAFSTFLNQNGVPRIDVQLNCRSGEKPVVSVEQSRLLPVGSPGDRNALWQIPLCVAYSQGDGREQTCQLITSRRAEIHLTGKGCPAWVLANSKETGYYEAVYPDTLFAQLANHRDQLTPEEQTGLFRDLAALTGAGVVPYSRALEIAPKLANDRHHEIALAAITLATIPDDFLPNDSRRRYADYIHDAFAARAVKLGWKPRPEESVEDTLLRPDLVRFVATATGDPQLTQEAVRLATAWLSDHSTLTPETVQPVLYVAAEYGTKELFDKYVEAARSEHDPFFKPKLVAALGHFRDPALAHRALNLAMSNTFDARMIMRLFVGMSEEPGVDRIPYEFTRAHYDELVAKLPSGIGTDYAANLPSLALANGCSVEAQQNAKEFFSTRMEKVQGGPRALANALESMRLCTAQRAQAEESIRGFFNERTGQT
jgi:cytosol alanyl aminopeptidase